MLEVTAMLPARAGSHATWAETAHLRQMLVALEDSLLALC
jgi:hypothetical protein